MISSVDACYRDLIGLGCCQEELQGALLLRNRYRCPWLRQSAWFEQEGKDLIPFSVSSRWSNSTDIYCSRIFSILSRPASGASNSTMSTCCSAIGSITIRQSRRRCVFRFMTWAVVDERAQMQALHDVVQAGYARYIGMSSCYAYQCEDAQLFA